MAAGLSLKQAAGLDDESAKLMIEAWDIAMGDDDGDDGVTFVFHGPFLGD